MPRPRSLVAVLAACALAAPALLLAPDVSAQTKKPKDKGAQDKGKAKDKAKDKAAGKKKKDKDATQAQPKGDAPVAKQPDNAPPPVEIALKMERATLDNGLRVVIAPDKTSATVAVTLVYDVGSRTEEKGRTGFAHLFEHMMFEGSANVERGEHMKLVASHGGNNNATTNKDRTNYFEVLPSNNLALALWLEADRMKSLAVTAETFENQRKVVQEEFRMRYLNVPYRMAHMKLEELAYQGFFPYEHSTIGSMSDLDGAKLEWVQEFFAKHYAPNNAVLAIAGDVDPTEAMTLVHKYFDGVAKRDVEPFADQVLPEQTSQRTFVAKDDNAKTPGVELGWTIPPVHAKEHYALELAAVILGGGESSRLHQLLVRDKALALSAGADTYDRRGPDLFTIDAKLGPKAQVGDVEKLVEGELKTLSTKGPSDAELDKAKRRVESQFVFGLQSNIGRAQRLAEQETFFGDARTINAELGRYRAVTKDEIAQAITKYLGPTRRTIVETYPSSEPDPKSAAEQPAKKIEKAAPAPAKTDKPAKKGDKKPATTADAKKKTKKGK